MLILLPKFKKCPSCGHFVPKRIYAKLIKERKYFFDCSECQTKLTLDHKKRRNFIFYTMVLFVIATLSLSEESRLYGFVVTVFGIVGLCEISSPFAVSGLFHLTEYHEDKDDFPEL